MIEYILGDIFTSPAQVIVNTVNTVGVMGKGIALEYKNRYPRMFELYRNACEKHTLKIGKLMIVNEQDHQILLFPTKENWRLPSKLEYIDRGLKTFVNNYAQKNISSIAFPKLGCGNGELSWDDVKPLMEQYLKNLPIDIYIYLGECETKIPEHKQPKEITEWLRENAKDMSFNGLIDDIKHLTAIIPYECIIGNEKCEITLRNNLVIENASQKINISEDEFYLEWDKIRSNSLIVKNVEDVKQYYICELLASLNYLVKVKIMDKQSEEMMEAYQLNEGLGRVYAYMGAKL